MAQLRDICITSFNTEIEWFKDWTKENKTIIKYIIIQGELCKEGKKHIQGFIQLIGRKRIEQIKKFFGDNTLHIEQRRGTVEQARDYCKEEKNGRWRDYEEYGEITLKEQGKRNDLNEITDRLKNGETFKDLIYDEEINKINIAKYTKYIKEVINVVKDKTIRESLIKDYEGVEWQEWQQNILNIIDNKVDNRKIYWIKDTEGNKGKSYLSKYLQLSKDTYYITGGKQQDILYGYNDEEIIIYDLSRTYADNMEHIYTTIENFKNGMYLSTKYETRQRIFKIPHIFIMANFEPNKEKLSLDRWEIINLDNNNNNNNNSEEIINNIIKVDEEDNKEDNKEIINKHLIPIIPKTFKKILKEDGKYIIKTYSQIIKERREFDEKIRKLISNNLIEKENDKYEK